MKWRRDRRYILVKMAVLTFECFREKAIFIYFFNCKRLSDYYSFSDFVGNIFYCASLIR